MRHRRKRDIIIELTSLLDVIMIMIFMVMAENSKLISEKQDALDKVQTENSEQASELKDLYGKYDGVSSELAAALDKLDKLDEDGLEDILEQLQDAKNKLQGYKYMDDIVIVINVSLENNFDNSVRRLTYSSHGEEHGENITDSENLDTAVNRLRAFVYDAASKAADDKTNSTIAYIIFSYDTEKVYQDDYAAINEALKSIEGRLNSGNVRYRVNPASQDERK